MATFTTFSDEALQGYLERFDEGRGKLHQPIEGGIENSNYLLQLEKQGQVKEWVLTLVEVLDFDELPFFNELTLHLAQQGLPVAAPMKTLAGEACTLFCGKPTLLFPKLAGTHVEAPTSSHCAAIGHFLGAAHLALASFAQTRPNPYSLAWQEATLGEVPIPRKYAGAVAATHSLYRHLLAEDLPRGLIHGDLFRDNALFEDGKLNGVIDFHHACHDLLIQDLAIAINDWCRQGSQIDPARRAAMVAAYCEQRQLTKKEAALLPAMQQTSALRFALTRYQSGDPPLKDPLEMLALMVALQARAAQPMP